MEVHHAGHRERPRSFKSFAFEFLMISIASLRSVIAVSRF